MKKIEYIFIEYFFAQGLEGCTEIASFAPDLMDIAKQVFYSLPYKDKCYLGIQYTDGSLKKIL